MTYGNITINTTTNQTYLTLPVKVNTTGTIYIDTHTHTLTANRAVQLHSVSTKEEK